MLREDVIVNITVKEWEKLKTCKDWEDVSQYPRIDLAHKNELGRIKDVRYFYSRGNQEVYAD